VPEQQLDCSFIESMLTRAFRTPDMLDELLQILKPEHFTEYAEIPYRLLWSTALQYQSMLMPRTGESDLIHRTRCYHTLRDGVQMEAHRNGIVGPQVDLLIGEPPTMNGLLYWTFFGVDAKSLDPTLSRNMLMRFLERRVLYDTMANALNRGTSQDRMPQLIETLHAQRQQLAGLGSNPVHSAAPEVLDRKPLRKISTGVKFLDDLMNGGHAPGEVNGLLGPSGVGKSQTAVALGWGSTCVWKKRFDEGGCAKIPTSYIVTYEMTEDEFRSRAWSHSAQIHMNTTEEIENYSEFSSRAKGDFKPYEIARHKAEYGAQADMVEMTGELDRFNAVAPLLREHVQIINMVGTMEDPHRGTGGPSEVAQAIARDQRRRGNPGVAVVIVDYVLAAVQRWIAANNENEGHALRTYTFNYVAELKRQIAIPMDCPVWALQQLNTIANKQPPTKVTKHTEASEAGNFAHVLAFAMCLGTKDHQSNCCLLNRSKGRRAGDYREPTIIHILGEYATLEDGTGKYVCDPIAQRIVPNVDSQFVGPQTCTPTEQRQGRTAELTAGV